MIEPSYINFSNLPWIEEQHKLYQENPEKIEPTWRSFFEGLSLAGAEGSRDTLKTYLLIEAYRTLGHTQAKTNPFIETSPSPTPLDIHHFGFTENDLGKLVKSFGLFPEDQVTLHELLFKLQTIYCGSIGYEYKNGCTPPIQKWLQEKIENPAPSSSEEQEKIYGLLAAAEAFETFLHTKYPGQKRFSLEGCETLIPLLGEIFQNSLENGAEEAILGMAHRGRLNVLANLLNKEVSAIFQEFEENYSPEEHLSGDVKYHKGFQGSFLKTPFIITLAANPSHLESVDGVVEGMAKARQRFLGSETKVIPILVHGDASIAGQGVVYETLQLSRIDPYATGGTLHIVINNQIGFTAIPEETRSTKYCTDIAKSFGFPVFHVNAEDALACAKVAKLSAALRREFGTDVFIDLIGYRKWGHNEGDEPSYTQPRRYEIIRNKPSILTLFQHQLIERGSSPALLQKIYEDCLEKLKKNHEKMVPIPSETRAAPAKKPLSPLSKENLIELARLITQPPENFTVNEKLKKLLKERFASVENGKIDWGFAELLALASLLREGISIRFSGQDSQRGTFSQRHAILVDQQTEKRCNLLQFAAKNAQAEVINSPLSEFAVMGFELGFSIAATNTLVLWEAQFGDFANGAQIIIDQYLCSGEQKWGQHSNLTLLLPHGYEGQGPEHSSARLERFLQLCAQNNMRIVVPTTPSQYFHALREQASSQIPCVIFTPKGLLRYSDSFSTTLNLTQGHFEPFLPDPEDPSHLAEHLILCSGKIFYDLSGEKKKREKKNSAIIRIEQLYPLDSELLKNWIAQYKNLRRISLIQEEPENMGGLRFLMPQISTLLPNALKLEAISREESASTATGSSALHKKELKAILDKVFRE